jgi:sterol desaturase/sphingolipid hydroxylase (fatty acid hydroxylase superfamily)
MPAGMHQLAYTAPVLLVLAAAEGIYLWLQRSDRFDWRDYFASLGDVIGRAVVTRVLGLGIAGVVLAFVFAHRVATVPMRAWWAWSLLVVLHDLCYYAMHRADHRVAWFWASHAVHHSTNGFHLSAAYRLGWTSRITSNAVFFAPLAWLGFPVPAILLVTAVNLLYQFWLHTELIGKLGWLEWLLNTPSHHRVHHASNATYLDRNYGGVFIVWDRLFGTFAGEQASEPCRYGLTEPLHSHNPFRIATHGWWLLWRKVRSAKGTWGRVMAVVGPP